MDSRNIKNKNIGLSNGIAIVKDFNKLDDDSILCLKNIENPIRVLLNNTPQPYKLSMLNDEVLAKGVTNVTLVLSSQDKVNWINLNDFQNLSLIPSIEIHNNTLDFKSIDGIQNFKHLKSFSLLYRYGKDIELELLRECEQLEKLTLEEPLTKQHHDKISKLKSVKKFNLKNLKTEYLTNELPNAEYIEVYHLQDYLLHAKMPNLKNLRIYNSNKLADISFLSGLNKLEWFYLYGLNKIDKLPDFCNLPVLSKVSVNNMKMLTDVHSLTSISALTNLGIRATGLTLDTLDWLTPSNFPELKNLFVELTNKKDTAAFYERFADKEIVKSIMLT